MFLDRSVLEVYANGRQCLTVRVYPEREDSNGVSIFARGSEAKLVSLDAWQMRSIWPELSHREGKYSPAPKHPATITADSPNGPCAT